MSERERPVSKQCPGCGRMVTAVAATDHDERARINARYAGALAADRDYYRRRSAETYAALEAIRDRLRPFVDGGEPAAEDACDIYELAVHALSRAEQVRT